MSKVRVVVVAMLIAAFLIYPVLHRHSTIQADSAPTIFEAVASPADPDPRDETSIAVSPQNEQIIVGASKVIVGGGTSGRGDTMVSYYFSSDGGHVWGSNLLSLQTPEKTWGRVTDPTVSCDTDGNFYLCVLMLDNFSFDSGVYVFKSTDNGHTFKDPQAVVTDIGNFVNANRADKCSMTVDTSPTSQFKNTIYVVWTNTGPNEFGQNATVVRFSKRRPADANFSIPRQISHAGDMRGPSLATGPNGEVFSAWIGMPARSLLFNASTDGGDSFLPGLASMDMDVHDFVGNLEGPNASVFISGVDRANSFPTLAVDKSNGPNRGIVYIAWAESTNRNDIDIFVIRITLQGPSLPAVSFPVRVNNDFSGVDQFFPSIGVDSSNGNVEIAFYDRRDDPGTVLMNMYLARSTDGGANFGDNFRVSTASSDPRVQSGVIGSNTSSIGIGDYISMVVGRGRTHILWTDTRHGKQEVLYGQLNFGSSPPPPPPPTGPEIDSCQTPRTITAAPFLDSFDTRVATTSADDPVSCTGGVDSNSVWYSITPTTSTVYGIDTSLSDYDTVLSVHSGACGALTSIACNDDFGNPPASANRSLLTFPVTAGVKYLIEVSGKGSGGTLKLRAGYPTISGIEFTTGPDGGDVLKITGAGFAPDNCTVIAQQGGDDIVLPNVSSAAPTLPDGSSSALFATRKKLKKIVKRGSILVRVESPSGSGNISNTFLFTR
jgi:hypothetical protein